VREHLATCERCRALRERYASVMAELDLLEAGGISAADADAARRALSARMLKERAERPAGPFTGLGSRRYILTAAAVLLAAIGLYIVLPYFRGPGIAFGDIEVKPLAYELTIFNEDLALVKDRRQIVNLKEGENVVRFTDVASQIDPTSVKFTSDRDPAGTHVTEQNYEYDLADASALLKRFVNRKIQVVGKDGTMSEGYLASYDLEGPPNEIEARMNALRSEIQNYREPQFAPRRGQVVVTLDAAAERRLQEMVPQQLQGPTASLVLTAEGAKGESTMVPLDDVATILLPEKPADLLTRPTLVWKIKAGKAGNHDTTLAYLTKGFSWRADYVVTVGDRDVLEWQGWVTVNNYSGTRYPDAKLKLIAGDVHRAPEPELEQDDALFGMNAAEKAGQGGGRGFEEKAFFEYHMYTLQGKTTLNNNQTKQIKLLKAQDVKSERRYVFDANVNATNATVELIVWNKEENHLGMPLPKGRVRFRRADPDGEMQYVGEDSIDHTPKDEKMTLKIGTAFDVVGERRQVRVDPTGRLASFVITVRNHKTKDAVNVIIREHPWGDWRIDAKSMEFNKIDANTIEFPVTVQANGEVVVRYTITYR
jgi:hypothetical protein